MNIALQFRPVNIRLYVAYMADAYHGGSPNVNPVTPVPVSNICGTTVHIRT